MNFVIFCRFEDTKTPFEIKLTFSKTKHASSFLANLTSTQLGLRLHRQIPVFSTFTSNKKYVLIDSFTNIFSLWRPLLTFIFQRPLIPVWAHILNNEIFNNKMQLHMNFILFLYFSIQFDFDKCTTFITKISGKYSRVWNRRRAENNHRVWKIYQKE